MGKRYACIAVAWSLALLVLFGISSAAAAGAPRITLTSPRACQVFQRGDAGRATILVTGRLRGVRGPVQVRWGAGPWSTVDRRPDGHFRCRLTGQRPGQASIVVRSARRPAVRRVCERVGVGDIYAIAGQSNASGRSPLRFSCSSPFFTATMFGNDDRWGVLRDPTDSSSGQVDSVSADRYAAGSVWPLVAQELMADERVPVAFVPCALGTTRISRWQPSEADRRDVSTLYGSLLRRIRAVGGRVRAVLFWQGEGDARALTPRQDYEAALSHLGAALELDCRAPLVAVQIGDYRTDWYTAAGIDAIRLAQQAVWGGSNVVAGPVLYDVDLGGEVHFQEADDMRVAARRWAAAILTGVLRSETAASPRLTGVTWDGDRTVTLTVDSGALPLMPGPVGGLVVRAEGEVVPVASALVTAAETVEVVLAEEAVAPLTVTLGSGRTAAGAGVPVESSVWRLPMAPFVDEAVAGPGG